MDSLPTDEQFLTQLYELYKDDTWVTNFDGAMSELYSGGTVKTVWPIDEDTKKALMQEFVSSQKWYQGQFITAIKDQALPFLEPFHNLIASIPVGLAPTRQLNACAIKTPHGGKVILLDHGVVICLQFLANSYQNFHESFGSEQPCPKHTRDEFAT